MFDLVIPTVGRESLTVLLEALRSGEGTRPGQVFVVDDRRNRSQPLDVASLPEATVLDGPGAGPAAARNVGWRAADAPWVVFVDDDVVPTDSWLADLESDLSMAALDVVAVQGRVTVPLPSDRRPTDWERNVTGQEAAAWITADMAVRRSALEKVGGFDERFHRAYREDADLALRLQEEGGKLEMGRRRMTRPVRPAPWWISLRLQAASRDDVLMSALHGADWQGDGAPLGRRRRHAATTAAGVAGVAGLVSQRPVLAVVALAGWVAGTVELAVSRIVPGPRTPGEVGAVVATSLALPPVATWHWVAGRVFRRRLLRSPGPTPEPSSSARPA